MPSRSDAVTVLFEDVADSLGRTVVDEALRISGVPLPSSSVTCAIGVPMRSLAGRSCAVIEELDVSGAIASVDEALPVMAPVWLTLPLSSGTGHVAARVVACEAGRTDGVYRVVVKFVITEPVVRAGLVGLVRRLKG